MQKIIATSAVWLALLSATAAPAAAQNREHQQLAAELRMLQEQNQQLSLALAQLTEALKAVNARLDTSEQFQQRRFADQEVLVKNLSSDLSAIRERTQDTDTRLRSLSDEIDALRKTFLSLPALIAQAAQPPPTPVDPNNPTATPPTSGAVPPTTTPSQPVLPLPPQAGLSPSRMYDTAFSDYTSGQYAQAITEFDQLIKNFPQAERADDAQFFVGESLSHLNRLQEAIDAYNLVIQKYSTGDQVDMAYYRRGFVEAQMGRAELARTTWEEVAKRYPESQGGLLAKQRLAGLSRPATATPAKP
jgi:tol-pal system protein YbgF